MSGLRLFGNRISPACKYCVSGNPGRNDAILCPRHGVVPGDYKCRNFVYDPLLRTPRPPLLMEQLDEESFSLE